MTPHTRVVQISFTPKEQDLLKILDELVKYDLAPNRSAWFKNQIRLRYYDMRDKGIITQSDEE